MRQTFWVIFIILFLGIATFGAFAMHADMQDHGGACVGAAAQGAACPTQSNPLEYLAFHFDAFKNFSIAITVTQILLSFLLISLFATSPPEYLQLKRAWSKERTLRHFVSPSRHRMIRWLAFLKNSPSFGI